MKIDIKTILWPAVVFVLGIFFILTISGYLQEKNRIESEKARAECENKMISIGETRIADCLAITDRK